MLRNVILWIIWYYELTNYELTRFSCRPELYLAFIPWVKWIFINNIHYKFHCFTVHFNSLNLIHQLMREKCQTNESIPRFEKEKTTSFPWLGVHILKPSPIRQHRIKKAQIIPEGSNTSSKWHILKNAPCSGLIQFIYFVTVLFQQKAQSIIQLLALE